MITLFPALQKTPKYFLELSRARDADLGLNRSQQAPQMLKEN